MVERFGETVQSRGAGGRGRIIYKGLRSSGQYQLGPLDRVWKVRLGGGRVAADRSTQLGIPKIGIVDSGGP
jgi:hypothetical protein